MPETNTTYTPDIAYKAFEHAQHSQLYNTIVDDYIAVRSDASARSESQFLKGLAGSDREYLQGNIPSSFAVTSPIARRKLLRTADEFGIAERNAIADLRIGSFACAAGLIEFSGNVADRIGAVQGRLVGDAIIEGATSEVTLGADTMIAELISAFDRREPTFMSESSITFNDDPEFFASIISHSLGNKLANKKYSSIDNHAQIELIEHSLPIVFEGDSNNQPVEGFYLTNITR